MKTLRKKEEAPPAAPDDDRQARADSALDDSAPPEAPEAPAQPEPRTERWWSWLTPFRLTIGAAAVPSAVALPWAATAVADTVPAHPAVAVTVGVVFDVMLIGTVVLAWLAPAVRREAQILGWAVAALASAAIALHTGASTALLFATTPLLSKGLWHLVVRMRAADEQAEQEAAERAEKSRREQAAQDADAAKAAAEEAKQAAQEKAAAAQAEADADNSALTVEQRREIADVWRDAAFAQAMAEAKATKEEAQILAANRVAMAKDSAEAERLRLRYELAAKVGGRLPIQMLAQMMPGLAEVTEVPTRKDSAAAAQIEAGKKTPDPVRERDRRIAATAQRGLDAIEDWLDRPDDEDGDGGGEGGDTPPVTPPVTPSGQAIRPDTGEGDTLPAAPGDSEGDTPPDSEEIGRLNEAKVLAAIQKYGPAVSTNQLARLVGLSRTTVTKHRSALAEAGHLVYAPKQNA
ncbi:winged helix-turn-helix domain-containing protein [Marinactinospora rubrisoli]|uniref:Winged helix-turn-helix domain-containing protein n=1 Tax=Marinactinospora rubrisoli TaxID=2715399 RepID=A0ABW2KPY9_9ACTN